MNQKTLSDFRVGHGALLEGLLVDSLAALLQAGVVRLDRVAQDRMRVRASAGAAVPPPCEPKAVPRARPGGMSRGMPPIPSTVACSHGATKNLRVRRRKTRPALARLDRPIQRRQIQLLDEAPNQAIRRKEIVPTDRPQRHLSPPHRPQAKPPAALTLAPPAPQGRRTTRTPSHRPGIEGETQRANPAQSGAR
jgi:hypothetical protein